MLRSLVGSEMCIRDSGNIDATIDRNANVSRAQRGGVVDAITHETNNVACLLYTSDAADDLLCVDLGGRRIIKKKKKKEYKCHKATITNQQPDEHTWIVFPYSQ